MFPNKSSSYAISSKANAFVQNFKVEGESTVAVAVGAVLTEPVPVQPPICCSAIPTYQVPDSTTDVTSLLVDGVCAAVFSVNGSANRALSASASASAATASARTVHMLSSLSSNNYSTQAIQIKCSHTVGCEPLGCHEYPCTSSKSEAVVGQWRNSHNPTSTATTTTSAVVVAAAAAAVLVAEGARRRAVAVARGKGGSGAGPLPLLAIASLPPTLSLSPSLLISLDSSVILTSSTIITTTCSSRRPPPPSLLSFDLQVSNAMIVGGANGNSSNSNSLSAQSKHPTLTLNLIRTIPHITSQANYSSQLKSDKFGAPYFQDENDNNSSNNNCDDYDSYKCINESEIDDDCLNDDDDDDDDDDNNKRSVRSGCECHAATNNIPIVVEVDDEVIVEEKEEEEEEEENDKNENDSLKHWIGGEGIAKDKDKKKSSQVKDDKSPPRSMAAEEQESFKNHCDNVSIINNNISSNNNNNNCNNNNDDVSCDYDDYLRRWGIARGLRLAGGGESSLNNAGAAAAANNAGGGWGGSGGGVNSNNNNSNSGGGTASWGGSGSGAGGGGVNSSQQQQQSASQQPQQQQNNNANNGGGNANGGGAGGGGSSQGGGAGGQWGGGNRQQQQGVAGGGGGGVSATSQQQQQAPSAQQNNTGKTGVSVAGSNNQSPNAGQNQQTNVQNQPPNQQNNNQSNQSSSGNSNQSQNGSTSWAAAAGKGLVSGGGGGGSGTGAGAANSNNAATPNNANNSNANANSNAATSKQLEQLNTMRESLFSLDGWGGQHVNQDSSWDIPPSPEPSSKDNNGGTNIIWKPNINNGTELWEANLRNGGQPPVSHLAAAQKTPWGHTPSSNLGGTWGEDDDLSDASNVWTGVPPSAPPTHATPPTPHPAHPTHSAPPNQWLPPNQQPPPNQQQPPGQPPNAHAPLWAIGAKKEAEWGGGGGGGNWDMRAATVDHMRVIEQRAASDVMRGGGGGGMSGRLGGGEQMWQQAPPHHHPQHQQQPPQPPHHQQPPSAPNKMPPPTAPNQWPGPPPPPIPKGGDPLKMAGASGWEEPSPPQQRRNIPNYDDGTSLWGAQQQRNTMQGQGKVSHWKEMPSPATMGRGIPPGIPQAPAPSAMPTAMPPRMPQNIKADAPLWGHTARNGSWEGGHEVGWGDDKLGVGGASQWNEPPWGGQKPKTGPLTPSWVDSSDVPSIDPSSWTPHPPKQPLKPLTKEIVWASKQFRILSEMGFKKDEVENALRTFNMSLEDALEYLNNQNWRSAAANRHAADSMDSFEHAAAAAAASVGANAQQQRFNVNAAQSMQFTPSQQPPGGAGGNITPAAIVQKILQQPPPQPQQPQQQPQQPSISYPLQSSRNLPNNQPSAQQLRMLVQQIQLAVQTGYLNHQILNQPLAPQTLLLLNQLLQQIKLLQQLDQQQRSIQQNPMNKNAGNVLTISVQITKTKQQIVNLQNQISAQQAIYVKQQQNPQQQQQQHHLSQHSQPSQDYAKQAYMHDPLSALQTNFADISLKETQSQQQSRLAQWKLPSLTQQEKDCDVSGTDFSRAPGSTAKSQQQPGQANNGNANSPNPLNPLLSQPDTTWSVGGRGDSGWPDSSNANNANDDKDWPAVSSASQAFTDLVPEFEPGKPWKGNQMKSIEDDPSITPGSVAVAQSPLSMASMAGKEDMFKTASPTATSATTAICPDMPIPSLSLSSSTWSFQPTSSARSSFNSPLSKMSVNSNVGGGGVKGGSGWGGDGGQQMGVGVGGGGELWSNPKPRQGPPPGLSKASSSNGWGSLSGRWGPTASAHQLPPAAPTATWSSTWLLLKNLTPQIDGSTLKTLCLQHGPLLNFHMYLSHGIAFVKYNTREEATKAQGALNNCVLGNTTIFADIQPEQDILSLLHNLSQQSTSSASQSQGQGGQGGGQGWSSRGGVKPPDTWGTTSQLWGTGVGVGVSTSSLWGNSPLDAPPDPHRTTPSSLNSFLPPDLLGGESM